MDPAVFWIGLYVLLAAPIAIWWWLKDEKLPDWLYFLIWVICFPLLACVAPLVNGSHLHDGYEKTHHVPLHLLYLWISRHPHYRQLRKLIHLRAEACNSYYTKGVGAGVIRRVEEEMDYWSSLPFRTQIDEQAIQEKIAAQKTEAKLQEERKRLQSSCDDLEQLRIERQQAEASLEQELKN